MVLQMHEPCEPGENSEDILRNVRTALIRSIILAFIPTAFCDVP
jgi:hypothetical protein